MRGGTRESTHRPARTSAEGGRTTTTSLRHIAETGRRALGIDYGIEASAAIATVWSALDAAKSPSLSTRVVTGLANYWLSNRFAYNSVGIQRGADSEAFQRLPDGSFFSPRNENHLVQSGERSLFGSAGATNPDGPNFVNVTLLWTGKDGDTIDFDSASSQECYASICSSSSSGYSEPIFKANHWSFPDGTKVSFSYTWSILAPSWTEPLPQCSGGDLGGSCIYVAPNTIQVRAVLTSVSNNLGRSLQFGFSGSGHIEAASNQESEVSVGTFTRITQVTDENGRSVSYALSDCPSGVSFNCSTFTVTLPSSATEIYTYQSGTDSPDPAFTGRSTYRLRRWFTPGDHTLAYRTITYDGLYRVKAVTDPLAHATTYYPGAIVGTENWKRSDVATPLGEVSTTTFDLKNGALSSTDPAWSYHINDLR